MHFHRTFQSGIVEVVLRMLSICEGGVGWSDAGVVGAVVKIVPDAGAGDCAAEGAETGVADRCRAVLR